MATNDLEIHLDRLIAHFSKWFEAATWQRVLIVESEMIDNNSPYQIPRSAFFSPKRYSDKFASLLVQGYSWINLNAAGVFDDTLLIVVEYPNFKSNVPITGVNFSGPSLINGKESWNIADKVRVID